MHDYSYAISKAIGHDVMECVHIIYYLIYGRFASTAYVSMISQNKDQQHKGLLWKKSLSSCGETSTVLMSPQIEKKLSLDITYCKDANLSTREASIRGN
jgi:hypothetical protein